MITAFFIYRLTCKLVYLITDKSEICATTEKNHMIKVQGRFNKTRLYDGAGSLSFITLRDRKR